MCFLSLRKKEKMERFSLFLSIIFVLVVGLFHGAFGASCSWKDPKSGKHYDLSPLKSDTDYFLAKKSQPNLTWDVWINVCRPVVTQVCSPPGGAGCQQWSAAGTATMGVADTIAFTQSGASGGDGGYGTIVEYTGGSDGRLMEINFKCKYDGSAGMPLFAGENPTHKYNFVWETKYACPVASTSGGISGGAIFLIFLLCLVFVYLVGGVAFNMIIRKQRGIEAIPNLEFWTLVPHLVIDGCKFVFFKITGRGSYTAIK